MRDCKACYQLKMAVCFLELLEIDFNFGKLGDCVIEQLLNSVIAKYCAFVSVSQMSYLPRHSIIN